MNTKNKLSVSPPAKAETGPAHNQANAGLIHNKANAGLTHDKANAGLTHDKVNTGLTHDKVNTGLARIEQERTDPVQREPIQISQTHDTVLVDQHTSQVTQPEDEQPSSVGLIVRMAREKKRLSLQTIAEKLHVRPAQIAALEQDQYDYFISEVFYKGYLRAYSKLLGLDPEPLITAYKKLNPMLALTVKKETVAMPSIQTPARGQCIQYWCAAVVMGVAVLLWALSSTHEKPSLSLLENERLLAVDKHDRSALKALEKQQATHVTTASVNRHKVLSNAITAHDVNPDTQLQVAQVRSHIAPDTSQSGEVNNVAVGTNNMETSNTPPAGSGDSLNFRFSADCWVKVVDSDNNILVSDLKRARQVLTLRGRAPFNVVLGFAPAVSLKYNGEQVTINSTRRNHFARLTVGQS